MQAGRCLANIAPHSGRAAVAFTIAATRRSLLDHELEPALEVLLEFAQIPEQAMPLISRGLESNDEFARIAALRAVRAFAADKQHEAMLFEPQILAMFKLEQESSLVLFPAIEALASLGDSSLEKLGQQLESSSEVSRVQCLDCIGRLGGDGLACFDGCLEILNCKESSPVCQSAAALAIGKMGAKARSAGSSLNRVLSETSNTHTKAAILIALAELGEPSYGQIPQSEILEDPLLPVALAVAQHKVGANSGVTELVRLLGSPSNSFADAALRDLGNVAEPELLNFVRDVRVEHQLRSQAIGILMDMPKAPYQPLLDLFQKDASSGLLVDAMIGHEARDGNAELIESIVGVMRENEGTETHTRLRSVLQVVLQGFGSGDGAELVLDSRLATNLLSDARWNHTPTNEPAVEESIDFPRFVEDDIEGDQEAIRLPDFPSLDHVAEVEESPTDLNSSLPIPQVVPEET